MGESYAVVVEALRGYSNQLAGDVAVPNEVKGLVGQADVGDESWGIVGIFVKGKYTEMLGDLQDLLDDMASGLQTASEKFTAAATAYQQSDDDGKQTMTEILQLLNERAEGR